MNTNENDENYSPVEPNKYQFLGINNLTSGYDINISDKIENVYICGYRINNKIKTPFLEYLLQTSNTGELIFPSLYLPENCNQTLDLVSKLDSLLTLLLIGSDAKLKTTHSFVDCYKGFYQSDKSIYMFFDLTNMEIVLNDIYRENTLWFCLVFEIMNSGHVCGMKVHQDVFQFLTSVVSEYPLYVLQDENGNQYECPIVVYVGTHDKNLNFTYTFGVTKKQSDAILGPYYYFTDFKNAIRQGGWSQNEKPEVRFNTLITDNEYGRYIKGGIIRIVLFLGKTKVKLNLKTDEIDNSSMKRERLTNSSLDLNYEKLTMRISDHDGNWAKTYDSVILDAVELDDGSKLKGTPMYVCKEYEQQLPLSYHYLNKKNIGEKYAENINFSIM
jgi:hypothetical protein